MSSGGSRGVHRRTLPRYGWGQERDQEGEAAGQLRKRAAVAESVAIEAALAQDQRERPRILRFEANLRVRARTQLRE